MIFNMLGTGLVAYLFHQMDKKSNDVPTTKLERNKNEWEHDKLYVLD